MEVLLINKRKLFYFHSEVGFISYIVA